MVIFRSYVSLPEGIGGKWWWISYLQRLRRKIFYLRTSWRFTGLTSSSPCWSVNMGMGQYLLIPFLGGWTSIYQLFWGSPGVQGFWPIPISTNSPFTVQSPQIPTHFFSNRLLPPDFGRVYVSCDGALHISGWCFGTFGLFFHNIWE